MFTIPMETGKAYEYSDSEGYYRVTCLPEGLYYARIWNDECYSNDWYQDADPADDDYPPIQVTPPDETPDINFTLKEGGSISGSVLDSGGNPFEWAAITVYDSHGLEIKWDYIPDGSYSVCGLATGDYYLKASASNDGGCDYEGWYDGADPQAGDLPPVHVTAPDETPNIDFTLEEDWGSISGRIVDTTGAPIAQRGVSVYGSRTSYGYYPEYYATSDSEGYYTVNCLATGDYYVRVWDNWGYIGTWYQDADPWEDDPPPVHVDAPNETSGINFTLEKGGSITGRVVDTKGDPIKWVGIELYDSTGNHVGYWETDSEGYYEVMGLPTGDYYVGTI